MLKLNGAGIIILSYHSNLFAFCFFLIFFSVFGAQQYDGGNVTLSQLTVQLTPEDDGKKLVCRAENSALGLASATAIEDTWLLDVYCEWSIHFLFCFYILILIFVKKFKKPVLCAGGVFILSQVPFVHTIWHTFAVSMRQKRSKRFTNLFVFCFSKEKKKKHFLKNIQGLEVRRLLGWGATVKS